MLLLHSIAAGERLKSRKCQHNTYQLLPIYLCPIYFLMLPGCAGCWGCRHRCIFIAALQNLKSAGKRNHATRSTHRAQGGPCGISGVIQLSCGQLLPGLHIQLHQQWINYQQGTGKSVKMTRVESDLSEENWWAAMQRADWRRKEIKDKKVVRGMWLLSSKSD